MMICFFEWGRETDGRSCRLLAIRTGGQSWANRLLWNLEASSGGGGRSRPKWDIQQTGKWSSALPGVGEAGGVESPGTNHTHTGSGSAGCGRRDLKTNVAAFVRLCGDSCLWKAFCSQRLATMDEKLDINKMWSYRWQVHDRTGAQGLIKTSRKKKMFSPAATLSIFSGFAVRSVNIWPSRWIDR